MFTREEVDCMIKDAIKKEREEVRARFISSCTKKITIDGVDCLTDDGPPDSMSRLLHQFAKKNGR